MPQNPPLRPPKQTRHERCAKWNCSRRPFTSADTSHCPSSACRLKAASVSPRPIFTPVCRKLTSSTLRGGTFRGEQSAKNDDTTLSRSTTCACQFSPGRPSAFVACGIDRDCNRTTGSESSNTRSSTNAVLWPAGTGTNMKHAPLPCPIASAPVKPASNTLFGQFRFSPAAPDLVRSFQKFGLFDASKPAAVAVLPSPTSLKVTTGSISAPAVASYFLLRKIHSMTCVFLLATDTD